MFVGWVDGQSDRGVTQWTRCRVGHSGALGWPHLDRGPSELLIQLGGQDSRCSDLILCRLGTLPGRGSDTRHRGLHRTQSVSLALVLEKPTGLQITGNETERERDSLKSSQCQEPNPHATSPAQHPALF